MQRATIAEFQAYDRKSGYMTSVNPFPTYGSPFKVTSYAGTSHTWDVELTDVPALDTLGKADRKRADYAAALLYEGWLDYVTMLRAEMSTPCHNMDLLRDWTKCQTSHDADKRVYDHIQIVEQLLPAKIYYAVCIHLAGVLASNEIHRRADERIAHANKQQTYANAA